MNQLEIPLSNFPRDANPGQYQFQHEWRREQLLVSGRFRRKLWPISQRAVVADVTVALAGRLSRDDPPIYNAVQRLLNSLVILAGIVTVLIGLAIWKPVQFQGLTNFFGEFDRARIIHFIAMCAIFLFLVLHVVVALAVPKSLRAMIHGR